MLCILMICDFVIVDVIELEFVCGFFVFIGEIGVGKFIFIDVLVLVMGGWGDFSVVCEGVVKVDVSVDFIVMLEVMVWLDEYEFSGEYDGVLLCWVIDNVGCSKVYINGSVVIVV